MKQRKKAALNEGKCPKGVKLDGRRRRETLMNDEIGVNTKTNRNWQYEQDWLQKGTKTQGESSPKQPLQLGCTK